MYLLAVSYALNSQYYTSSNEQKLNAKIEHSYLKLALLKICGFYNV